MEKWRQSVNKFLQNWEEKDQVIAAMACGSYITGNPTKHSDVDLHLILRSDVDWRERGNKMIDGIHIEYFANPAKQIERYMKEDYEDNSCINSTMFLTGETIFDYEGILDELKKLAKKYKETGFPSIKPSVLELKKYSLWDEYDNVQDSYELGKPDFYYVYYAALQSVYDTYAKYLRYPVSGASKVYDTLTKVKAREKYLLAAFPDESFVMLFGEAVLLRDRNVMMREFEVLVNYVLGVMGGFSIDGWRARSSLQME